MINVMQSTNYNCVAIKRYTYLQICNGKWKIPGILGSSHPGYHNATNLLGRNNKTVLIINGKVIPDF